MLFWKKWRWPVLAVIALAFLLSWRLLAQPVVTVSVLMQALEKAQWESLVAQFNSEHGNIRLEVIEGPNASDQVQDLYTTSFLLGNSPYDLVYMDIVWVPKFAAAGWLRSLNEFLEAETSNSELLPEFLAGDVAGGSYQGKLYRMPFRSDAGMLYYRTDLLEDIGAEPPETFQELMEISAKLQSEGRVPWGYLWQGKQYEGLSAMFVEILQGFGAFWVDPGTLEVGLDQPNAIAAVEFLRRTVTEGISPPGVTTYAEEETRRLFQSGDATFLRNWPYVYELVSQPDSAIAGKFAIKPMVSQPGQTSGACLGGWGLGIAQSTKHPEAAWEVVKFMSSAASQKKFVIETGYVPSRRALFNDPEIVAKFPYYPDLLSVVESSVLRPPIAQYAQASDILQRYLSAAIVGSLAPEKAMRIAARETRQLLAR